MALSQQNIYDALLAAKNGEAGLAALNSESATAIWRLLLWVNAGGIAEFEARIDTYKQELESLAQAAIVGDENWYRTKVLQFQFGDPLVYVDGVYQYATIDPNKRIVARCATEEVVDLVSGGVVRVKVAKLNGVNLTELNSTERDALAAYLKKVRFAGTKFQIFSNNGDVLKVEYQVYYDPIIPLNTLKANVENAIKTYVTNLPFNGELLTSKLTDEIQKITGVLDVVFVSAAAKFSAGDAYQTFTRNKVAGGGYFQISSAIGETLNDTIQYIAL